jgi:hypothetical protein
VAEAEVTLRWIWLDWNGQACGGIGVDEDGIIRDGAPYFRFLRGRHVDALFVPGGYVAKTPLADDRQMSLFDSVD